MAENGGRLSVEQRAAAIQLKLESGEGLPVQGTSMRPTFGEGQLLWIEFKPQRLRRGDVILFSQDGNDVVHRVVSHSGDRLRTRGDGKITLDRPVAEAAVLGRVVAVGGQEGWRGLRSPAARAYGSCVAWHDLFWAGMGALALRIDRALRPDGESLPLRGMMARVDRALLRLAHLVLFRLVHGRVEPRAGYTEIP